MGARETLGCLVEQAGVRPQPTHFGRPDYRRIADACVLEVDRYLDGTGLRPTGADVIGDTRYLGGDLAGVTHRCHAAAHRPQHVHLPLVLVQEALPLAVEAGLGLTGHHQHGRTGERGFIEASDRVGGSRAGRGEQHAHLARCAVVGVGCVRGVLLVADLHHLDAVVPRQRLVDRQVVHADDAEHMPNAQARQRRRDGLAARHLTHGCHSPRASITDRTVALWHRRSPATTRCGETARCLRQPCCRRFRRRG